MRQEQCVDLFRHLIGGIVANAGQSGELVWRGDELACPLGCRPSDRVVLVAPDEQGWHSGRSHRLMTYTSRPIPRQRGLHRRSVSDDGQVCLDRSRRHTFLVKRVRNQFALSGRMFGPVSRNVEHHAQSRQLLGMMTLGDLLDEPTSRFLVPYFTRIIRCS